jgi:hypothetical protein
MVPPYGKKPHAEQNSDTTASGRANDILSSNEQQRSSNDTAEAYAEHQAEHSDSSETEPADTSGQINEIPRFDLAEQIVAEHRKITAVRRKAPAKKARAQNRQSAGPSAGLVIKEPSRILSEKDPVIAEIVARDIENLYRRGSSNLHCW